MSAPAENDAYQEEVKDTAYYSRIIEGLLFASGNPMPCKRLAKVLGVDQKMIDASITALIERYAATNAGLRVLQKDDKITIVSHPDISFFVDKLIKDEVLSALSQASLEVLSIVAYRAPIARGDIEAVRGVNCNYTLRNLALRGLIERIDNPHDARGYLYRVSFDFLKHMGLERTTDLPEFAALSKDERIDKIIAQENPETASDDKKE